MSGEIRNGVKGSSRNNRYTYFHLSEQGIAFKLFSDQGEVSPKGSTKSPDQDLLLFPPASSGAVGTVPSDPHIGQYASLSYPLRTPRYWFRPDSQTGAARTLYVISDDPTSGAWGNRVVCDGEVFCNFPMHQELISGAAIVEVTDENSGKKREVLWVVTFLYRGIDPYYGYFQFDNKYRLRHYDLNTKEVLTTITASTEGVMLESDYYGSRFPPLLTFHPNGDHAVFVYVPKTVPLNVTGILPNGTYAGVRKLAGPIKYRKITWEGVVSDFTPEGVPPITGGFVNGTYNATTTDNNSTFTQNMGLTLFPQFDPVTGYIFDTVSSIYGSTNASSGSGIPYMAEYLEDGTLAVATISGVMSHTTNQSGHANITDVNITVGGRINNFPASEGRREASKEISDSYSDQTTGEVTLSLWDGVTVKLFSSEFSVTDNVTGGGSASSNWSLIAGQDGILPPYPEGSRTGYESHTVARATQYKTVLRRTLHLSLRSKFAVFFVQEVDARPDDTSSYLLENTYNGEYYGHTVGSQTFHKHTARAWVEIVHGDKIHSEPTSVILGASRDTATTTNYESTSGGWSGISPASNSRWVDVGNNSGSVEDSGTIVVWTGDTLGTNLPLSVPNLSALQYGPGDLFHLSNWTHSAAMGGVGLGASAQFPPDCSKPEYAKNFRWSLNYLGQWKAYVSRVEGYGDPSNPPMATQDQVSLGLTAQFPDFKRVSSVRLVSA